MLCIIYVYNTCMAKRIQYPDWVEKYRTEGVTVRKVRDGYGLYKCTSKREEGKPYPKLQQEYLGMITEKNGFIPKKSTSAHPVYIEYGFSHFLWENFKRDIIRGLYRPSENLAILGVIRYIFGSTEPFLIRATYLSDGIEDALIEYAGKIAKSRISSARNRVDTVYKSAVPDEQDRTILEAQLRLCVMDSKNRSAQLPALPAEAAEIIERYGFHYEQS